MKKGDQIISFELPDQDGNTFKLSDAVGQNNLVIYFYPKDDTPGCTKEACSFRDSLKEFDNLDAKVIGISADSVESHKTFAEKYNLNFTLLSDTQRKVRRLFKVSGDLFGILDGRVTFVIDKNGIVQHVYRSQLNSTKHIEEAKTTLEKLS
ncbi:MAG TPA: peroxiredoxin [Bacteroidales bacterium]|nr:peroxiredoxin [Bacteroidales bacterium]